MASANQTTSNEKIETDMADSTESKSSSPVPPKRKIRAKGDDITAAQDNVLKSDLQTSDTSRVVFVDNVITKSEVLISNSSDTKDSSSEVTNADNVKVSESTDQNINPDCQVVAGNTKLKIASFLEKVPPSTGGSQVKIVLCKINVSNQASSTENYQNAISKESSAFSVEEKSISTSEQNKESVNVSEKIETSSESQTSHKTENSAYVIQNVQNLIQQPPTLPVGETSNINRLILAKISASENSVHTVTNNVVEVSRNEEVFQNKDVSQIEGKCISVSTSTSSIQTNNVATTTNLHNMETTENSDHKILKTSLNHVTEAVSAETSSHVISTETESVFAELKTIEFSKDESSQLSVEKLTSQINTNNIDQNLKSTDTFIENISISKSQTIATQTVDSTPKPAQEVTPNKHPTAVKPSLMKKPTVISLDKVLPPTKIPPSSQEKTEKAEKDKSEVFKVKKAKGIDRNLSFDNEPKLTKKQRTSSEQCLSLSKSDSEQATSKKLRSTLEQQQHEIATYKRLLESERSAFREHRAVYETEARKEKAEAKRREASLESQLRVALKGQPALSRSASAGDSAFPDIAKLATALENAKSANKSLQEKLQVVSEADKRKAGELRAQHDAHAIEVSQMERDSRAQAAKLLEEVKSKERQIEQLKKGIKVAPTPATPKGPTKMAVADQLHFMEGQISRLEHEIQRRDDIIQTLRNTKVRRDRRLSAHLLKDNLFKDILSDVDSAVSSAPNSLSPQPSPDLWYHPQDSSSVEVDEGVLETARKQIQDLEKALTLSTASYQSAQLRATQLEEQLQDLREHADLLEFRCLELEDASEKRNSLEELTDSDSGCTSPENRLKISVSPQLRRSDSGYKSPTRPSSPNIKNQRILTTPTANFTDCDPISYEGHKEAMNPLLLEDASLILDPESQNEDIRYKLERMMVKTHSESDRNCLEQVLQLLWNLQALSGSFADDDYSVIKHKKTIDNDFGKNELETKSRKIIATISPYSQKSSNKPTDLIKSVSSIDETDHVSILLKEDSKKLLYGLQESGIFEEAEWESKETQTEWCDCICTEPESDLATEVQRLNQIREQLEKSGAIRSKNLRYKHRPNDIFNSCSPIDLKQQTKREKNNLELYENRIILLENKIAVYESSGDMREKKLAQRLQREIDLQSKIKNLEFDLSKLRKKYIILEEERCEFEEAENDTRLHCQELEAEFDILTAKLRDMDDQRTNASNDAECYRGLVEEYENKNMELEQKIRVLREKIRIMEKAVPALIYYNLYQIFKDYSQLHFQELWNPQKCQNCRQNNKSKYFANYLPMIGYRETYNSKNGSTLRIEKQLNSSLGGNDQNQKVYTKRGLLRTNRGVAETRTPTGPKKQPSSATLSNKSNQEPQTVEQENVNNHVEELISNEVKMKQRIEELEKRELAFLETLTKGDEMWADMEFSYKQKIKENEENEAHLVQDRNRWKGKYEQLHVKMQEIEENESIHKYEKKKMQEEVRDLSKQKELLSEQLTTSQLDLLQTKSQMDDSEQELKKELASQKRTTDNIHQELLEHQKIQKEIEDSCSKEVANLKKDLVKAHKQVREQEVTIAALLEEVHSLEKKLMEVSDELIRQKTEVDEKSKSLLDEIRNKTVEVEHLQAELAKSQELPSAEEELSLSNMPDENCKQSNSETDSSAKMFEELEQSTHICKCSVDKSSAKSVECPNRSLHEFKNSTNQAERENTETILSQTSSKNYISKDLMKQEIPNSKVNCAEDIFKTEKPELPKRKPKVSPRMPPKLRAEVIRKRSIKTEDENKPENKCEGYNSELIVSINNKMLNNYLDSSAKKNLNNQKVSENGQCFNKNGTFVDVIKPAQNNRSVPKIQRSQTERKRDSTKSTKSKTSSTGQKNLIPWRASGKLHSYICLTRPKFMDLF